MRKSIFVAPLLTPLIVLALIATPAHAASAARAHHSPTWTESGSDQPIDAPGSVTYPERQLHTPADRVTATVDGIVPNGNELVVDVRVRQNGQLWTEWEEAWPAAHAALPFAGQQIQARIMFRDTARPPTVRGIKFSASRTKGVPVGAPRTEARFKSVVFATREGLVGRKTANGHKIIKNDRFVALPSRRGLASRDTWDYTVTLRYRGRVTTVPVWDVGPWNVTDDYWNGKSYRQRWNNLPRGRPQAQEAFFGKYNNGKDGFGRKVRNPAGIDLADGVFWNDLKMNDNDWVEVTYNWL